MAPELEPSYDPTDAVNAALDAARPPTTPTEPRKLLGLMLQRLDISTAEHDAGSIFARLASMAIAEVAPTNRFDLDWKSADGKWSRRVVTPPEAAKLRDFALSTIRTDNRRKAVMLALGARETSLDWDKAHRLVAGLEDLARYWIGGQQPTPTFVNAHGVTMPKLLGENDATLERLAKAENDTDFDVVNGARVMRDSPFERMRLRRQLDPNPELNETLYAAGLRYFQDWHLAGMGGIATPDLARPMVDGGKVAAGSIPERRLDRLQSHANARAKLGPRYYPIVEDVVIEGRRIRDVADGGQARASAKRTLTTGLRILAVHYGMMGDAKVA